MTETEEVHIMHFEVSSIDPSSASFGLPAYEVVSLTVFVTHAKNIHYLNTYRT